MKNSKRVALLVLALVLTLALVTSASAAQVTVNYEGHTFKAYQIFTGTATDSSDDQELDNVHWGTGVDPAALINAMKAKYTSDEIQALDANSTAAAVAKAITDLGFSNDSAQARELALLINGCTTGDGIQLNEGEMTTVVDGYYIVKDTTPLAGDNADVQNLPLLQVTGTITIAQKVEKPTLTKEILHDDPNTWGIVGDNQIGDTVQFKVTSKVPDVAPFTTYTFTVHDTMSKGLALDANSFVVTMGDTTLTAGDAGNYTVTVGTADDQGNTSFTVAFSDAKTLFTGHKDENITVAYNATLTEDTAKLLYKETNTAYLEYSTTHDDTGKGTTVPKVVTDFSFSLPVMKVDGGEYEAAADKSTVNSLGGAKFVLNKSADSNANPITFTQKDGNYYVVDPAGTTTEIETVAGADGKFYITGLNDATDYYLWETQAPAGYNPITDPIKVTITATYDDAGNLTGLSASAGNNTLNYTVQDGAVVGGATLYVENNSGSHLPETGGIGTTIFYVGGAVIMLLAVALLIARKKMSAK